MSLLVVPGLLTLRLVVIGRSRVCLHFAFVYLVGGGVFTLRLGFIGKSGVCLIFV